MLKNQKRQQQMKFEENLQSSTTSPQSEDEELTMDEVSNMLIVSLNKGKQLIETIVKQEGHLDAFKEHVDSLQDELDEKAKIIQQKDVYIDRLRNKQPLNKNDIVKTMSNLGTFLVGGKDSDEYKKLRDEYKKSQLEALKTMQRSNK